MGMTKARREKKNKWKVIKRQNREKLINNLKPKIDKYLGDKIDSLKGFDPETVATLNWCSEQVEKVEKMTIKEMGEFIETYIKEEK
jgi:hypothetical protein